LITPSALALRIWPKPYRCACWTEVDSSFFNLRLFHKFLGTDVFCQGKFPAWTNHA
jgi:hypothetical protein